MKKIKITTIIFLAALAICLSAILILLLSSGGSFSFGRSNANYTLAMEKEIEPEGIQSLKVEYGMNSNDVFFYQGTGDSIVIREYLNFTPRENQISTVVQEGMELQVNGARKNNFFFFSFRPKNAYTEIYLPAGFTEKMNKLYVKTLSGDIFFGAFLALSGSFYGASTSGDVLFPQIAANEIQLRSTSGEIRLQQATGNSLIAETTSGDIAIEEVAGEASVSSVSGEIRLGRQDGDIEASSTSGDITIEEVAGETSVSSVSGEIRLIRQEGDIEASSTSGDIRVQNLQGSFEMDSTSGSVCIMAGSSQGRVETTSGDISIFLAELTGDLDISTTSGEVNLKLPETASFNLDFDSTSGECNTFFDEQLSFNKKGNHAQGQYGSGGKEVSVSTTSGDLRISRYQPDK